jgi:hypothetical protein
MIEAASVSFHPADIAPLDLTYNRNVVLIIDWSVSGTGGCGIARVE